MTHMAAPTARGGYFLVTGAHRLAAAKRLGWSKIDAFLVAYVDDAKAEMIEIAENLDRAELTALERDEHVARWLMLAGKPGQVEQVSGGRGKRGGDSEAARQLGFDRSDVRRAKQTASLTPEAKQAARDTGLDDNRSALLKAATAPPNSRPR